MNEQESLAMWKLYSSQNESVCIQSTFRRFEQLLPPEAFLGTVKYIDYDKDLVNMANSLNYIVHKRRSFEHERELRAAMWKPTARDKFALVAERGMIVPTRVADLIENIFVSPTADPILEEVVNGLKETYALLAPVNKSSVNLGPDY